MNTSKRKSVFQNTCSVYNDCVSSIYDKTFDVYIYLLLEANLIFENDVVFPDQRIMNTKIYILCIAHLETTVNRVVRNSFTFWYTHTSVAYCWCYQINPFKHMGLETPSKCKRLCQIGSITVQRKNKNHKSICFHFNYWIHRVRCST